MPPPITPPDEHAAAAPSKKKLREMKLRADPLADVLGPTLVRCLGCGAAIKLSHKSEYDASHWTRHRARCLKKAKAHEAARRSKGKAQPEVGDAGIGRGAARPRARVCSASSDSSAGTSSPTLSSRALTPPEPDDDDVDSEDDEMAPRPKTVDALDRETSPGPAFHASSAELYRWKSWDWSQLRSRFLPSP
ncbi:hypothetical protein GGX14DRAFT_557040 [Mycena pura]|uniref:Uncharacterized protein n=1 Tax=Mycena pura TaxID=153505 RepID=A0AAD6YMR0_9AGAR|nr:hypothetical protein GGX14DRAFT_557040 [Mycena pura]